MKRNKRVLIQLSLFFVSAAASAWAQPAPIIRTHTSEIGGFVGASYGLDKTRVMGGGNIVYSLTRVIMPFAEVSYFPGIGRNIPVAGSPSGSATVSVPITDYNFGLHVRVPIPKSRVIPYAVISFGGVHSPDITASVLLPDPLNPGRTVTDMVPVKGQTSYATSAGGGLRFYTGERWGFRAEFKAYVPRGTFSDPFYRVTAGFFYQF